MEKIKLHKWLAPAVLLALLTASCSRKSISESSSNTDDKYESSPAVTAQNYTPPPVITIPDEKASTNKEGELYYDDAQGYRYWRYCDGKYYLDRKYNTGKVSGKKLAHKKTGRKARTTGTDGYAISQ